MPWRESTLMDERLRFVARRLEGESMTALCREFGISRKTGHKLFARWKAHGLEALADRRASRDAMPTGCRCRSRRRSWRCGASARAGARASCASCWRAGSGTGCRCRRARRSTRCSTVTAWSSTPVPAAPAPPARRSRSRPPRTTCGASTSRASSGSATPGSCYPLTVTDQVSRYVLMVEALEGTREAPVFTAFHRLFRERGLPARFLRYRVGETVSPSPAMASTVCRGSRSGGSAWASASSASPRPAPAERPPRAHAPDAEA